MNKIKRNGGLAPSLSRGFTLIEILVVIGIIAILAAIVVLAINPARQFAQANNAQRSANVNAILNGIGQYIADNKGALPSIPDGEITTALCNQLVPTYLPSLPTDPKGDFEGALIEPGDCGDIDPDEVGYEVDDDSTGRVTVCAPLTEQPPATEDVCVTR